MRSTTPYSNDSDLTADPGTSVMRHTDAGYDLAVETANERGLDLPMVNG